MAIVDLASGSSKGHSPRTPDRLQQPKAGSPAGQCAPAPVGCRQLRPHRRVVDYARSAGDSRQGLTPVICCPTSASAGIPAGRAGLVVVCDRAAADALTVRTVRGVAPLSRRAGRLGLVDSAGGVPQGEPDGPALDHDLRGVTAGERSNHRCLVRLQPADRHRPQAARHLGSARPDRLDLLVVDANHDGLVDLRRERGLDLVDEGDRVEGADRRVLEEGRSSGRDAPSDRGDPVPRWPRTPTTGRRPARRARG